MALRAYELSKLRFYFAVAVCDSSRTAESLYAQLDGIEFEHSAMVFDMRFVPDDISFADRKCRDKCKGMPGASYKPPEFVVKALTVRPCSDAIYRHKMYVCLSLCSIRKWSAPGIRTKTCNVVGI